MAAGTLMAGRRRRPHQRANHPAKKKHVGGVPQHPQHTTESGLSTAGTVPFIEATKEHFEVADDRTIQVDGNSHPQSIEIPANGFLRAVYLDFVFAGGVLGAGALLGDAPFAAVTDVQFTDTNSTQSYGPADGYAMYIHNKWGGYSFAADPTLEPGYVGTINAVFSLRIPIEINGWDGYGSIGNMNASNPYRIRYTIAPSSNWNSGVTTQPTIRVRTCIETWSDPPDANMFGQPNELKPPSHGTLQFWTRQTKTISVGNNNTRLEKVGYLIRNIFCIARSTAANTPRDDTVFPDNFNLVWDTHQLLAGALQTYIKRLMHRRTGFATIDSGVFVFPFTWDNTGKLGFENRHLWVPTIQGTRLEFQGSSATAGTIDLWVNDVAPVPGQVGTLPQYEG